MADRKVLIYWLGSFFTLIIFAYLFYEYKQQKKTLIILSSEKNPIFYHNLKVQNLFSDIEKSGIDLFVSFFEKIHSHLFQNHQKYKSNYHQFYPGYYFLNCKKFDFCLDQKREIQLTISQTMQNQILKIIQSEYESLKELDVDLISVIIIEKSDKENLLRVITNYGRKSQIDTFTRIRMAGSTLKPFLYAIGFETFHFHSESIIEDTEKQFYDYVKNEVYIPRNHDNQFIGRITIREALSNSRNIPAVQMLEWIGVENFSRFFYELGISQYNKPAQYGLSLALGSGGISQIQLSILYSILANEGELKPLKIGTYKGKDLFLQMDHQINYERKEIKTIFRKSTVNQIQSILSDNETRSISFGRRNYMNFNSIVSTKTGTSRGFRDSWIVGFTEKYIVSVWVGKVDQTPMMGISGIRGGGKIYHNIIKFLKEQKSYNENIVNLKKLKFQTSVDTFYKFKPILKGCRIFKPYSEQVFYFKSYQNLKSMKIQFEFECDRSNFYTIKIYKENHLKADFKVEKEGKSMFFLDLKEKGKYKIIFEPDQNENYLNFYLL